MADDLRQYPPTTRRLRKLYEAGIFPYSQVLTAAIVFLAVLVAATTIASRLVDPLSNLMRDALTRAPLATSLESLDDSPVMTAVLTVAGSLVVIWAIVVLAAGLQRAAAGAPSSARQLLWREKVTGLRRPRPLDWAWELTVSVAILGGAALIIFGNLSAVATVPPGQPDALIGWIGHIVLGFGWRFGVLLVGLGLCDYLYQRAIFGQAAAMTRRELEDEIRETEGPWLVRWWRRRRIRAR